MTICFVPFLENHSAALSFMSPCRIILPSSVRAPQPRAFFISFASVSILQLLSFDIVMTVTVLPPHPAVFFCSVTLGIFSSWGWAVLVFCGF